MKEKKTLLVIVLGVGLLALSGAPQLHATLTRFIQVVKIDDGDTRMHIAEIEAFEVGVTPNEDGFGEWDGLATSTNDVGDGDLTVYGEGEIFPDIGTTADLEHGGGNTDPNNELETGGAVWSTANNLPENAQYTLDLGEEVDITTVRMWPRADGCCSWRWSNLEINLYGDDGSGNPGTKNATVEHVDDEGNVALEFTFLASVDTDEDGMPDGYETAHGLDPEVNDADGDLDGDGISNLEEFENGTLPEEPDTDGDGLTDSEEIGLTSLSTAQEVPAPTLGDATPSGWATVNANNDTREVTIRGTYRGMTSAVSAAHLHGLADPGATAGPLFALTASGGTEGTIEGSGILSEADFAGFLAGRTYINIHTANNGPGEIRGQVDPNPTITDPLNPDTDGDNLSDGRETNTGVFVEANKATDTGTDPTKADTDADGFKDGVEVTLGSDPTDMNSVPASELPIPLVYFDFEGDTVELVTDKSGNNRDGVVVGEIGLGTGAPDGPTPGQGGLFAIEEEGYLDVTEFDWFELVHDNEDVDRSYTLSTWLRVEPGFLDGQRVIWGQTAQGVHNGIRNGGFLHTAHWGNDFNAGTVLDEDTWVHAAWTYDGAEGLANIYLNGELDLEDQPQRAPNGSGNLIVGNRNGGQAGQGFVGSLDDVAIWNEVLREDQIALLASGASPIGADVENPDSDGDGMLDSYEERNGLVVGEDDSALDKDEDGLTNKEEHDGTRNEDGDRVRPPTLANDPDSDDDGVGDKAETNTGVWVSAEDTGTHPLRADSDRDGLADGIETNTGVYVEANKATDTGTDPNNPNTDGDVADDGREVETGFDPTDPNSFPPIPPLGFELIGMDLTDPEDDGDPEFDEGYNAIFAASEEEGFGGGEFAFNVFDNELGPSNAKWCCGSDPFPEEPIWVQATFEDPIVLSMFSIASANDIPGRDPLIWEIQGSNDGENFETIFRQEDDVAVWEERLQVAVFTAGVNYDLPSAYTTIRFICFETGLTSGARFQVGELEFFGSVGSVGPFQITDVQRVSRDGSEFLQITWPSTANGTYAVETGMNLSDDWTELVDGFESQGDATTYELELEAPVPSELYIRVREE